MKRLSFISLVLCILSCAISGAHNMHFFRNDGKYNVFPTDSVNSFTLGADDSLHLLFNNTAKVAVAVPNVDSVIFLDSCITPRFYISLSGADTISRDSMVPCSISVQGFNVFPDVQLSGQIRGRGNSSWLWYPKKPYRLKLDTKTKVMGYKKSKDFALLANYRDPTFLMNSFAFELADYLDMPFSPKSRFCEVYLNNDYKGLYLFTQQIKKADNRVELDDSTGILLELDVDDGPDESPNATNNFWATMGSGRNQTRIPACVKYPDDELLTSTRMSDVQSQLAELTSAINNHDYASFSKLMDVQSFIDFIIVQEMTYNVELEAPRSMYLYRYNGTYSLWHMGPVWDFDGGFSFNWNNMTTSRSYFVDNKSLIGATPTENPNGVCLFFIDMFNSPEFCAAFKARWNQVKSAMLPSLFNKLDSYKLQIQCAMERDTQQWNFTTDFDEQFSNLKSWLNTRFQMEDENFNNLSE